MADKEGIARQSTDARPMLVGPSVTQSQSTAVACEVRCEYPPQLLALHSASTTNWLTW